jgi:hypothetical protein
MVSNNPRLDFNCPEKWNSMSAQEDGRYCGKCEKVVTDFSQMSTEEVLEKINTATSENACGSFKAYHLQQPFNDGRNRLIRFYSKIYSSSNKNKFKRTIQLSLVMVLLFISGCHRRMSGFYAKPSPHIFNKHLKQQNKTDSLPHSKRRHIKATF